MSGLINKISKNDIDEWFTTNYGDICSSIDKLISNYIKYNRKSPKWTREDLITDAYTYILKKREQIIERQSNIEAYFRSYIKFEVTKYNSKLNKFGRNHQNRTTTYCDVVHTFSDMMEDSDDMKHKLFMEKLYNIQKSTLVNFFKTLSSEEKILYDVIYNRGINTISKLTKHFGINKNIIINKRKSLNIKLQEYINEHYEKVSY